MLELAGIGPFVFLKRVLYMIRSGTSNIHKWAGIALVATGLLFSGIFRALAQNAPESKTQALPFVSPIFGDNMVLQRDKADKIWGWSEPGDTIQVKIGSSTASAVAGADHRWQAEIQAPPSGGPYTVEITGRQHVELNNVLVGDVWLCTGQSNMEFPLRGVLNSAKEIQNANYPQIRFLTVPEHPSYRHTDVVDGQWEAVSPETATRLSAVSYYFAKRVQQDIHIPIGLVVNSVGGTTAETWMSVTALHKVGGLDPALENLQKLARENAPEYGNYVMHWYDEYDTGLKENWADPTFHDSNWKTVDIMNPWASLGVPDTPSVVWFRKEVTLPDPMPAGRTLLFLGEVDRMDSVWVNGKYGGGSAWVENPRVYGFRPGMLNPGKNVFVIRILRTGANGGFLGKAADLYLLLGDGTSIPMEGEWKAKVSVDARPPHPLPISYENWPVIPSVLYKGMLEPIGSLSITGAIWYQGESNVKRGYEYRRVLPALIANWRELFNQGDFPFYIVSLPFNGQRSSTPTDDGWAAIRESQAITAEKVPDTCLAITIDTGDANSVHPRVKEPVGDRLAYCALGQYYGEKIQYQSPTLTAWDNLTGAIRLHFAHAEGGLVLKYQPNAFQIAGADHKWYWADAHVFGDVVIVSTSLVQNPVAVRYDWQSNPPAILFNRAGLPAGPFRTDNWPGITDDARPY
jgi:sialate O-acetylesterase